MNDELKPPATAGDLEILWGAAAIAREIDRSERQTYHMLEAGELPARKIANRWCCTRRALRRLFEGEGG